MTFSIKTRFKEHLSLNDFSAQQFLVISIEAAKKLGWIVNDASRAGLVAATNNGLFNWNGRIIVIIGPESVYILSESITSESRDTGRNEEIVKKFIDVLLVMKHAFTSEELATKFEILEPKLSSVENWTSRQPQSTFKENLSEFISFFIPRKHYFITPILVDINILIFFLMLLLGIGSKYPEGQNLLYWGANSHLVLEGQWWRLITNIFIHSGPAHLFVNMFAFVYIGLLLEHYLGNIKFILAYFLTGIMASIMSLFWHDANFISVGASGAIFGMFGVFVTLLATKVIHPSARAALLPGIVAFILFSLYSGVSGPADNAAHIGGLLSGMLLGGIFYVGLKRGSYGYQIGKTRMISNQLLIRKNYK